MHVFKILDTRVTKGLIPHTPSTAMVQWSFLVHCQFINLFDLSKKLTHLSYIRVFELTGLGWIVAGVGAGAGVGSTTGTNTICPPITKNRTCS